MVDGPLVTVIVPARDAATGIRALLDALHGQTVDPVEVLVVDDASRDDTAAVVAKHPVGARVLTGDGRGPYVARNLGLREATAPVVAFTDADCVPDRRWLEHALAALGPGVLVGGRIEQQRRDDATVWERYDRATYLDQRELVAQGFAATANLVTHTATLRELGGFNDALRSSGDRELGQRATRAGLQVVYADDAVIGHVPRKDARGVWKLHRRLGAGWRALHRLGYAPSWWEEPALRVPLGRVVELVADDGPPLRRRQLAPVHAVAMAARWRGRLLG
jgi:glycosyltransferase involved in cell wall biosynthesis